MPRQIDRERSATLRQLAHDLKNPLTAVQVLADMLKEDVPRALTRDVEELIEALDMAVMMADGLSNLARLEAGEEPPALPEPVDLNALVREVALRPAFRHVVDLDEGSGLAGVDRFAARRALCSVFVNGRRMVGGRNRMRARANEQAVEVWHPGVCIDEHGQRALRSLYGGPSLKAKHVRASALGLGYAHHVMAACDGQLEVEVNAEGMRVRLAFPSI